MKKGVKRFFSSLLTASLLGTYIPSSLFADMSAPKPSPAPLFTTEALVLQLTQVRDGLGDADWKVAKQTYKLSDLIPVLLEPYTPLDTKLIDKLPKTGPSNYLKIDEAILKDERGQKRPVSPIAPPKGSHPKTVGDYMVQIRDSLYEEDKVYSGFTLRDIEYFISANPGLPYRFYDPGTRTWVDLPSFTAEQLLKDIFNTHYPHGPQFILRRGLKTRALEFFPIPESFSTLLINTESVHSVEETGLFPNSLTSALAALHMTLDQLRKLMDENSIVELILLFDVRGRAPEETFKPSQRGPADAHFSYRLMEPILDTLIPVAIMKVILNITIPFEEPRLKIRRIPPAKYVKETKTLPPWFVAWLELSGLDGVREGLSLLGKGAKPLAKCFENIIHLLEQKEKDGYFVKYYSIYENFYAGRLDYMIRDPEMESKIIGFVMDMMHELFEIDNTFLFREEGPEHDRYFYMRDFMPVLLGSAA